MPPGFSDLLVVQTLRTEMTYVLVGRREDNNDCKATEKVHYQLHKQL